VNGIANATDVAAGAGFSCAALADGSARCWGDDGFGQLGDGGGMAPAPEPPVAVFALSGVKALSAHAQHACAVRDDETLWCWGRNNQGQIGDGTMTDQAQPVRVAALTAVTHVSAGLLHTCAATRAAGLFCWGNNDRGQLGQNDTVAQPLPAVVSGVPDAIAVAAGAAHTCAVRRGGDTLCWGDGDAGEIGDGLMRGVGVPVAVSGPIAAVGVVAGTGFSCAQGVDGALFCWGDDHYGQLAVGRTVVRPRAAPVVGLESANFVATGDDFTCASTQRTDHVSCWGGNQAGQLGREGPDSATPAEIRASPEDTYDVAARGQHACTVSVSTGEVFCWGNGKPVRARVYDAGVDTVMVGNEHTCVITRPGLRVQCFGDNTHGQLGDGTTTSSAAPVTTLLPSTVDIYAAGSDHTCVVEDRLYCWGRGDEGQLGDGQGIDRATPVAVVLDNLISVAAGAAHTCAIVDSDRLFCWGRGVEGQLGVPGANVLTPTEVPGIRVGLAAAGGAHTCGVVEGGVVCWGANEHGQLGAGDTDPHSGPAPVIGLTDVADMWAGGAHTCVKRTDGSVWCWGANTSGQLGDGGRLAAGAPGLARLACE
jgi:alpha-tubulin suppressor-like RCC1 family protein